MAWSSRSSGSKLGCHTVDIAKPLPDNTAIIAHQLLDGSIAIDKH